MYRLNMIKTVMTLTMVAIMLTGTAVASDLQQFRADETNAGIAADSAPVVAPDNMTTCDVQLALLSGGE